MYSTENLKFLVYCGEIFPFSIRPKHASCELHFGIVTKSDSRRKWQNFWSLGI